MRALSPIFRLLIFVIITAVVIILVNAAYFSLVLSQKTFYKKEILYQQALSADPDRHFSALFFGDSHAFHAVNPEYIPDSYNYASGAENYIKSYYKLRKVLEHENVSVDTIVLELDLHTFSTRLTDQTNLFNELELYSDFVSLAEVRHVRHEPLPQLWREANIPVIGNGKEFGILLYQPALSEVNSLGWLRNKGNFSLDDKQAIALANYKDTFEGQERISNVSFDYFIKTLELAEQHGVNIVFIQYPYTNEYKAALTAYNITEEGYYDFIFEQVNETIDHYSVLDYSHLFAEKDYLSEGIRKSPYKTRPKKSRQRNTARFI